MISDHVRNARDASKCVRRRVGAVVVIGGAVVATGYNHIPLGRGDGRACDEGGCPRGALSYDEQAAYVDYGNCHATHAEVAACEGYMAAWGRPVPADAVVVVSCRPCDGCAAYLSGLGVSWEVVDVDSR